MKSRFYCISLHNQLSLIIGKIWFKYWRGWLENCVSICSLIRSCLYEKQSVVWFSKGQKKWFSLVSETSGKKKWKNELLTCFNVPPTFGWNWWIFFLRNRLKVFVGILSYGVVHLKGIQVISSMLRCAK